MFLFPHLFSIPFIKSALLCAEAAGVSPPISGRWAGVGWELGVLASIYTTNLLPHSLPQIPLAPSVPSSPPKPFYLTDILDLYWGYLGRILTISLPYILGLSHFLNTFNTLSQLVHHTCTTIPKQVLWIICIHAYIPSLHLCTSIPPPFPHSAIALVVLQYARPKGVIFPPFHSNFNIFASTETFKQTENIFLWIEGCCQNIASVLPKSSSQVLLN